MKATVVVSIVLYVLNNTVDAGEFISLSSECSIHQPRNSISEEITNCGCKMNY